jgi:hypothetical protein
MCAQLVSDFGIPVTRVNNGSPARKKDEFANADAEKWFAFRRLLEKREVILPVDGELLKQLSSRRLQYDSKARIQLEPKESMRNREHHHGNPRWHPVWVAPGRSRTFRLRASDV